MGADLRPDDFASDPLTHTAGELFNPPALTNFLGACQAARCVLGVQHLTFPPFSCGESVLAALTVDDVCLRTSDVPVTYRWRPDRIERSARVNGWGLESVTVMAPRKQQVVSQLRVRNTANGQRRCRIRIRAGDGVIRADGGWNTPYSPMERPRISVTPWEGTPPPSALVRNTVEPLEGGLRFGSRTSAAVLVQATWPKPNAIRAPWLDFDLDLGPGESRPLHLLVSVGGTAEEIEAELEAWRGDPAAAIGDAEQEWAAEITAVFTPGNERYSGFLPTLRTGNPHLERIWRNTILGAVYHRREHPLSAYGRTYTTMMPRYWVTTSFLNDWSLSAWLLVTLDPVCVREHLERWLERDLYAHFGTEYVSGADAGNWYGCNDYAMTRLIGAYLRVTGDLGWLRRRVGERTVLEWLQRFALHHAELDHEPGLADYGDRNSLLEAVGSYTHEVASLNAAAVWILREVGAILDHVGDGATAGDYRSRADGLARRVQELYVPGAGYWSCRQPDGALVECRHAWDFVHVLGHMREDLAPAQVEEMVRFFERELRTPAWMHALSPLDADVDFSLRPDHQWNGCYPGWVGLAAIALVEANRVDLLRDWLPGLAASANQGPYSQAHLVESFAAPENGGARKAPTEWPYINDWAILCVGGFYELVVQHLFGVDFGLDGLTAAPRAEILGPDAELAGVTYHGRPFRIDARGNVTSCDPASTSGGPGSSPPAP